MTPAAQVKRALRGVAGRFGYDIVRSQARQPCGMSPFDACLRLLANQLDSMNFVQVGANDGVINDPLHQFLRKHADRSRVVFVEPQSALLPVLQKNYEFHPSAFFLEGAVGPDPSLELHSVDPIAWADLSVPYAKGWPPYRAPTGVTSSDRELVLAWVRRHYEGSLDPEEIVRTEVVRCMQLEDVIAEADLFERLDVLQIDAEGFDDAVIYASNLESLRPLLINFEVQQLDAERRAKLWNHLSGLGYEVMLHGIDALAVRETA